MGFLGPLTAGLGFKLSYEFKFGALDGFRIRQSYNITTKHAGMFL